jgi:3-hydroxyacyl-CoA dehydrogenase
MYIYKAAVVGGGTMGGGIAQVITYSGLPVILKDIDENAVQKGLDAARKIYKSRVDKGKMTMEELEAKMLLISGTTTYDGFEDVDLVIEAVPENIEIKKQVFKELDDTCPESTILSSNTSALSISEMARVTGRPDKVIGMHFFNPAHVMKLIEVIPGLETSEETTEDITAFSESLRKIPVRVKECAGFLVNRVLGVYLNEAVYCLTEGAESAKEIDRQLNEYGMPMGPYTLLDMLGNDIAHEVSKVLYEEYGPRMAAPVLSRYLVEKGWLGTKSGRGFYNYEGEEDDELEKLLVELRDAHNIEKTEFSIERLIYPMINESIICLDENVATASDIDIGMMAGCGFPKGPLAMADEIGLDRILETLLKFRNLYGLRFWPSPLLKRKVKAGQLGVKAEKGFYDHI